MPGCIAYHEGVPRLKRGQAGPVISCRGDRPFACSGYSGRWSGRGGSFAFGRRRYQRMNSLITVARSDSTALGVFSRSVQSSSLMRTERCCVPGLFGMLPTISGVRTEINATSLRCTYDHATVSYVHQATGGDTMRTATKDRTTPEADAEVMALLALASTGRTPENLVRIHGVWVDRPVTSQEDRELARIMADYRASVVALSFDEVTIQPGSQIARRAG